MANTFDDDIILSAGVDVSRVILQTKQAAEQAQKLYAEVAKTAYKNNIKITRQQKKDVVAILLKQKDESLRIAKAEIESRLKLGQKEVDRQLKARERANARLLETLKSTEEKWLAWDTRKRTTHEKEIAAINRRAAEQEYKRHVALRKKEEAEKIREQKRLDAIKRKAAENEYRWHVALGKKEEAEKIREQKRLDAIKRRAAEQEYRWHVALRKKEEAEKIREQKRLDAIKRRAAENEYAYHVRLIKKKKAAELAAQKEIEARKAKTFMGAITGGTTFGHKFATTAQYATAGLALWKIESAMVDVVEESARFDTAMYENMAVLGASSKEAKALAENSRDIGRQFGGSIEEIDQLTLTLGRAGVALKDLNDTVRVGAELATLTGESYNDVAGVLSTFRLAYEDSAITTRTLGDELTYAANASRLSIKDLGTLSNYALTTSRALGLTAEQTLALSTAFSNLGLNASTIGTQIRKLDLLFNSPSKHMQKFWNDFITATGMTKEAARSNITEFIKTLGELSEKDESFIQRSTSGMEQLTAQLIRNLALGKDYFLQHVDALKNGGDDLALQARVMAQSAEHIGERIRNAFITLGDGAFTVLLDDIFDRDRVKRLYDELKTLKRGTVEYKEKATELKGVLDDMDTKFIGTLEPVIRAVGLIKDGFTGVKLVLKTLEHAFYLSALSINKTIDYFITDKLNAIIDGYNTFATLVGATKIEFHIKNETTDELTQETVKLRKETDDLIHSLHDGRDAAEKTIKSWKEGMTQGTKAANEAAGAIEKLNKNLNQTLVITPDIKKLFTQTFGESSLSDLKNLPAFDMTSDIQSLLAQAGVGISENINLEQAKKRVEYAKKEYLIAKDRNTAAERFKALLKSIIQLQKLQAAKNNKLKKPVDDVTKGIEELNKAIYLATASDLDKKLLAIGEKWNKLLSVKGISKEELVKASKAMQTEIDKAIEESGKKAKKEFYTWGDTLNKSISNAIVSALMSGDVAGALKGLSSSLASSLLQATVGNVLNGGLKGGTTLADKKRLAATQGQIGQSIGMLGGSAVGGGGVGSQLASMAGSYYGMAFGPVGAVAGGVIAGALGGVVDRMFGGKGPSRTDTLLANIDKELKKQTKLLDAQVKLAQAFDRTGTALIAQFKEMKVSDTAWRDKFAVKELYDPIIRALINNTGGSQSSATIGENASIFGVDASKFVSGVFYDVNGVADEVLKTKSNLEIFNTVYENHIIGEKKYQELKDEVVTHNKEYVASILNFVQTISSINEQFNDILTSLTGTDILYQNHLEAAKSDVSKVMNYGRQGSGGAAAAAFNIPLNQDTFTAYLTTVVNNLDRLGTSIKGLEGDLTSSDPEVQARAIKQLEEATSKQFDSSQAALDYAKSIELVGEYYVQQNENLEKAKKLYAGLADTSNEYNKSLILQKLNTGDLTGITWDQIDTDKERAAILKKYIDGEIGLTDAQLDAIDTLDTFIGTTHSFTDAMDGMIVSISSGVKSLLGMAGQQGQELLNQIAARNYLTRGDQLGIFDREINDQTIQTVIDHWINASEDDFYTWAKSFSDLPTNVADELIGYLQQIKSSTAASASSTTSANNTSYKGASSLWQGIYDTSIAQRDKLLASVNNDYTYKMFKNTMAAALGAKNGDVEVFSNLVKRAAGYSGSLDNSSNFSSAFEQRFARASAANAFDSFAKKAETQLSVLQDVRDRLDAIESNTKRTADITETQWRAAI